MKLIKEICLDPEIECKKFKLRRTARAVLLNDRGEIALINETLGGFHLLPGGGIEKGESIVDAVKRECLEEAGADVEIFGEIGMTIEYRNTEEYILISYCHVAKVVGDLGVASLSNGEKSVLAQVEWHKIDDAIGILQSQVKAEYTKEWQEKYSIVVADENSRALDFLKYKFSVAREVEFLNAYKELKKKP